MPSIADTVQSEKRINLPGATDNSWKAIFGNWPRDDRIEHPLQSGINYLMAGKLASAQPELMEARWHATGSVLEGPLRDIASNINAAHASLMRVYSKYSG